MIRQVNFSYMLFNLRLFLTSFDLSSSFGEKVFVEKVSGRFFKGINMLQKK